MKKNRNAWYKRMEFLFIFNSGIKILSPVLLQWELKACASSKYPIRLAPIVRAGPLRCPAELWISFTGVAFSWEEMPN